LWSAVCSPTGDSVICSIPISGHSLNYERYLSSDAPDYILFSETSIDYAILFDESKTKLAVLNHYSVVGSVKVVLYLRKKQTKSGKRKKEETVNVRWVGHYYQASTAFNIAGSLLIIL
jgi:hypothetical protein